jgi:23S rRNA (uracil1939-C5)-methyltransferase
MLEKNEEFTVVIEDISEDGAGIGKTEGFTWFVKDTVIGDVVEAKVMKKKKNYGFARLVRVITPSPDRVEPKCAVARACGGCQLQAMDYKAQLRFKERKIYGHLTRIGGVEELVLPGEARVGREDAAGGGESLPGEARAGRGHADGRGESVLEMEPILGMENPWRYRNKAQFPCGRNKDGKIVFGFYAGRTHAIIEQNDCVLGIEENGKILEIIGEFMEEFGIEPYDEQGHSGLVRHVLIRKGFKTGEIMVCLVINGDKLAHGEELVKRLKKVEGMVSVSCNINRERTNVILGEKMVNLFGPGYITDRIGAVTYRISPQSFYQVNPLQTEKLYQTALEYAGLTGEETVWDLYCGIGTISLFLAQKAKKVYGVEIVPAAVEDARENARINGITNAEFYTGRAEAVLPEQYEKNGISADVIVVDPPRKGCDKACLDTIVKMAPKRVVYISCDSATLARDVKYLRERGYQVKRVRGIDQFGHCVHTETCVMLSKIGIF